jgi:hypothetical protein
MNSETKECQNCKKDFTIEPDDFSFYEKIKIPPPTFCPECRRQRRLSYRNDYVFYNRKCDLCKREIISIYSPSNPQTIYCNKCWWSDEWDPKSFGKDYNFSKSFFEQFKEFREKIPALALVNDNGIGSINSEYVQDVAYSKDCYMAMVAWKIENCMYFSYGSHTKDAVDSLGIFSRSEGGIYEAIQSQECFGSKYIQNSNQLINCSFCFDCRDCSNCFMCFGLRNKKYYFKNQELSKEKYNEIISSYNLNCWSGVIKAQKEFEEFKLINPHKYANLINCTNCLGENLTNSKNSQNVFNVHRSEDSKYLENGDTLRNSYDLCVGGELEQCYEGLTPDNSARAFFTNYVWKSLDVSYSDFCMSCQNCFGSAGLKKANYCIFNKQYSKEEYFKIKDLIIESMKKNREYGEFFPMKDSPFAYNESMANISFPLVKQEATKLGLKWQDNIQQTKGKTTLFEAPDNIIDVKDSILSEILECNICKRNYKITDNELKFYRKWMIPVPRYCFFCRLSRRFQLRGPSKLWHRKCMNKECNNEFETSYAPDRLEIVYCEKCYQQEVY